MTLEPRRLLIVSPRFPPLNAPDHHRIRTSLPYYREYGWEPTVLCVTSETTGDSVEDPALSASVPDNVAVERVPAWSERACRRFGFGQLDFRSFFPLLRAGNRLLERRKFDVVYFSTTVFLSFLLGPIWKRRFGCRIVYDFQDPWYYGDDLLYTRRNVPGSWWKFRLVQLLAGFGERRSMRAADQVVTVSEDYADTLAARYPWLGRDKFTLLPFGAAGEDFDFVAKRGIRHSIFPPGGGKVRWVYAGRVGPDMTAVLRVFFKALSVLKNEQPDFARALEIHFVGTNYAPVARTYKVVEPLAREFGVADVVREHSPRIPYFETLSLYRESDGILLIGADTKGYTASKLFNCALSGKPVLALFHAGSLVSRLAQGFPSIRLCRFEASPTEGGFGESVAEGLRWLERAEFSSSVIAKAVEPWSARRMTAAQCAVFDKALGRD